MSKCCDDSRATKSLNREGWGGWTGQGHTGAPMGPHTLMTLQIDCRWLPKQHILFPQQHKKLQHIIVGVYCIVMV